MRIAVDAFGGDNAPIEIVKGAALASKELSVDITLTGDESQINKIISDNGLEFYGELRIIHTTDVISMHDEPTSLLKAHKESSMALAFKELTDGNADAFVSAGSTGAVVVGGTLLVKRIKGVKRPALAGLIPSPKGHYMLMDMGANAECRPEMLEQFGIMASAYLTCVEGIENPKIGLLNIGVEDSKGTELQKQAYQLLSEAPINFVGNIESRDVIRGNVDVVVADGYSGNICLKTMEGMAEILFGELKAVAKSDFKAKIGGLLLKSKLRGIKEKYDYKKVGGAPLLGVSKIVLKCHGNSKADSIATTIEQAFTLAKNNMIEKVSKAVSNEE